VRVADGGSAGVCTAGWEDAGVLMRVRSWTGHVDASTAKSAAIAVVRVSPQAGPQPVRCDPERV